MIDSKTINQIKESSIEERIKVIELILETFKEEVKLDSGVEKSRFKQFRVHEFSLGKEVDVDREQMYLERGLMKTFAIDTNLLVYAHNKDSKFHEKAKGFLEKVMNERNEEGKLSICIPAQVLMEFVNVITRQNIEKSIKIEFYNTHYEVITL
jgi:hypothetical protein